MNGAKHRFSLILTCLLLTGLTVVYPFLLYTDNAFVTKWREWYIETAMGTMTHQWLATSFIPHDMIEKVMAKINEQQARLKELEQKKLEAENSEIVEIVRGMSVSLTDLPVLLQTIKSGGTLGQNVPKSADKEDSE